MSESSLGWMQDIFAGIATMKVTKAQRAKIAEIVKDAFSYGYIAHAAERVAYDSSLIKQEIEFLAKETQK